MKSTPQNGFSIANGDEPEFPVLLSVPHSGRDYPSDLKNNLRIPANDLLRLEDRYADLLVGKAKNSGFPVIQAHKPRAWIDLNRAEDDIDAGMLIGVPAGRSFSVSAKQRGGLGLIPRRLSGAGDVWKRPFSYDDIHHRITSFHRPYHNAIGDMLAQIRAKFGLAILIDIHSMPPVKETARSPVPSFVVGDRFGGSAAGRFAEMILAHIEAAGHICSLNHPYAGDHILRQHGQPRRDIHAVQLEIDRSLYLDSALREPAGGVDAISSLILEIVDTIADAVGGAQLLAAE